MHFIFNTQSKPTRVSNQRGASAYIRHLGNGRCATPATQKRRRPRDQGTPEGRQGVHPTPWQCRLSHACHEKRGGDQETKGRQRDARAYIRPLGSADCPTPATQKPPEPEGRQRYVYIYMPMYAHMYMHMYVCVYMYIYIYMCVCVRVCVYMCMCMCICICVYIYVYVYVHVYIYVCVYVNKYICIYLFIYLDR